DPRTAYQRAWTRDDPDHHLQTWSPRLLANLLFETGFDVRECRVVTSAWHPRLFPFARLGLGPLLFWLLAIVKSRRQVLAVATNPGCPRSGARTLRSRRAPPTQQPTRNHEGLPLPDRGLIARARASPLRPDVRHRQGHQSADLGVRPNRDPCARMHGRA